MSTNRDLFKNVNMTGLIENNIGKDILDVDGIQYSIQEKYLRSTENELSPFENEKGIHAFSGKKFTAGRHVKTLKTVNGKFVAISATFDHNHKIAKQLSVNNL